MNIFYNGELFYFKYCNKTIYIQHKIISVSFDISK
ncbi:unknown [Prevotella sp. CAG:1185]|nr:unknown [Prevotella sp. CAG:1185]